MIRPAPLRALKIFQALVFSAWGLALGLRISGFGLRVGRWPLNLSAKGQVREGCRQEESKGLARMWALPKGSNVVPFWVAYYNPLPKNPKRNHIGALG